MVHFFSSDPFYSKYVHLPGASSQVLPQICYNPKFLPFFRDALSVLDGSHFASSPPWAQWPFCQNHKDFISQNCLFACSFDFLFVYAMTSWEGSANDARVWADVHSKNFVIPMANIISQMLAILPAENYSPNTKMYAIILPNGVMLVWGMNLYHDIYVIC